MCVCKECETKKLYVARKNNAKKQRHELRKKMYTENSNHPEEETIVRNIPISHT